MFYTQVGGHKPLKTLMETISEHPLIGSKVENGWKWKEKIIYHLSRTTILNHCGQCFQRKLDKTCIWSHNSYPKPYQISSPSSLWTALPQKASILWILSSLAEVWVLKWFTPKLEVTNPSKPWWKPFQNIQAEGHLDWIQNWKRHQGGNICPNKYLSHFLFRNGGM